MQNQAKRKTNACQVKCETLVSRRIFSKQAARQIQNTFLAEYKTSALAITEACLSAPTFVYTYHTAKGINDNRAEFDYQMPFCTTAA